MIKKTLSLAVCLFILLQIFCVASFAASDIKIRQVSAYLPDVNIEISGSHSLDDIDSVIVDDETLSVKEVCDGDDVDKTLVYVLVDISTSMSQSDLNALKPKLIDFADSLGKKDRFVLKTFGTEVETVLEGGEDSDTVEYAINNLWCNSDGTTFYEALNKTLKEAEKKDNYDRKYAIVISDGADFEKGNSSHQEVIDSYTTHKLPIYALCSSAATKTAADDFGYIARTSGGELRNFSSYNASSTFDEIIDIIDDVTIIKTESSKRKSTDSATMVLSVDGDEIEQEIYFIAEKDKSAPTVEITFDKEAECFVFTFSENVDNADKASSYLIKKGKKEIAINNVIYEDGVAMVETGKKMYSGKYTFEFFDITDATDDRNPLDESVITTKVKAHSLVLKILSIIAIILIPVGFLAALYLILLNLKKKKNVEKIKDIFVAQVEEKEQEQIHIEQPKGTQIKIHVDCCNGQEHRLVYNLVSSMIVGRDSICDLCIEDDKMSKQHFVVEIVDRGLAVTDLQTTNGTYVNGVQIHSRTFMPKGTKICAGNSIITITY